MSETQIQTSQTQPVETADVVVMMTALEERLDLAMDKIKRQKSNVRGIREELDALKAKMNSKDSPVEHG